MSETAVPTIAGYSGPGVSGARVVGGAWGDPPAWPVDDEPEPVPASEQQETTGAATRQEEGV